MLSITHGAGENYLSVCRSQTRSYCPLYPYSTSMILLGLRRSRPSAAEVTAAHGASSLDIVTPSRCCATDYQQLRYGIQGNKYAHGRRCSALKLEIVWIRSVRLERGKRGKIFILFLVKQQLGHDPKRKPVSLRSLQTVLALQLCQNTRTPEHQKVRTERRRGKEGKQKAAIPGFPAYRAQEHCMIESAPVSLFQLGREN